MNPLFRQKLGLLSLLILAFHLTFSASSKPIKVGPAEVELVARYNQITPSQPFQLGLRILPEKDWHVYWKNPGDAGLPPALKWTLPEDFTASEIEYAAPSLIPAYPFAAYGYHGEALYPVTIHSPSFLNFGDTVNISVKADWLICREECVPGTANLSISLPVVEAQNVMRSIHADLFDRTAAATPMALPSEWTVAATVEDDRVRLSFATGHRFDDSTDVNFFADTKATIEHAAEQIYSPTDRGFDLTIKRSQYSSSMPEAISGVLATFSGDRSDYYQIEAAVNADVRIAAAQTSGGSGLWLALLLAFAGGIILNLMPCVLPVLSLKVIGLIEQAGENRKTRFLHSAGFTLGILVTFWALVIVMLTLQAGGAQLGWGFQLQSPLFVMIMTGFIFLLALNMFGVYEISFLNIRPGRRGNSVSGAFVSGIMATLLATPCTAPFMGTALGYSLTQPPIVALAIYSSLGLGMAAPYLLFTVFPALLKFVPKPGRWMETLKHFLGFLLMATVIWLAWVFSGQTSTLGVIALLGVLLVLALGAWIFGRWSHAGTKAVSLSSRLVSLILILTAFAAGAYSLDITITGNPNEASFESESHWISFTPETLANLRASGQPVFVDFTAAWCLSCQVNEKVVLESKAVQEKFRNLKVNLVKADWTRRSDEITRALAAFGRNSVPLYVLYHGESDPLLLPEILTPDIVLNALKTIEVTNNEPII